MRNRKTKNEGIIITYVLIFGTIFLLLLSAFLGYILQQLKYAEQRVARDQALDAAESGIDYYRWCLNNNVQANCLGEKDYTDKDGNVIGKFLISVDINSACGQQILFIITSTGWTNKFPASRRTIRALYGRRSVAAYAGIISAGVWFGADESLNGPFMANGGVRMDGPNQSLVSSAALLSGQPEWVCDYSYGCSPCPTGANQCHIAGSQCVCPGVFTTTANSIPGLFQFPVPPFDFNGITVDLGNIKTAAQAGGGIYFPKSTDINANGKGYHLKFQNNGTVQVYIVTAVASTWGYDPAVGYYDWDDFSISSEYLYGTYVIPPSCSVIYVEDRIWPEGVIKGKVALATANLVDLNVNADAILKNNITYASSDGSDGFTLVSEGSVYIGPQSADNLELHGIFVAQTGAFTRNHYPGDICTNFILYGSYISSGRTNQTWVGGGGTVTSGYRNTAVYYDANLIYNPPPFVAAIDPNFKIVSWQEIE